MKRGWRLGAAALLAGLGWGGLRAWQVQTVDELETYRWKEREKQ